MNIVIRELEKKDFEEYKRIKLESLKKEPLAFDTSYEEAISWKDNKWNSQFESFMNSTESIFYIAEAEDKLVGFAYFTFNIKVKKKHIMEFPTMYVTEEYRGKGVAFNLLDSLIEQVRKNHPEIIKIQLSVYSPQEGAIALYKEVGFEIFGEFQKELFVDGKYYDQIAMELFL